MDDEPKKAFRKKLRKSPVFRDLADLMNREKHLRDALWFYRVGERIKRLLLLWRDRDAMCTPAEGEQPKRTYGDRRIDTIAGELKRHSPSDHLRPASLRAARVLASKMDRQTVKHLGELARERGMVLSRAHIEILSTSPDPRALGERCIRQGWSTLKLRAEATELEYRPEVNVRRVERPKTYRQAADKLLRNGQHWLALCEALLSGTDGALLAFDYSALDDTERAIEARLRHVLSMIEEKAGRAHARLESRKRRRDAAGKRPGAKRKMLRRSQPPGRRNS